MRRRRGSGSSRGGVLPRVTFGLVRVVVSCTTDLLIKVFYSLMHRSDVL